MKRILISMLLISGCGHYEGSRQLASINHRCSFLLKELIQKESELGRTLEKNATYGTMKQNNEVLYLRYTGFQDNLFNFQKNTDDKTISASNQVRIPMNEIYALKKVKSIPQKSTEFNVSWGQLLLFPFGVAFATPEWAKLMFYPYRILAKKGSTETAKANPIVSKKMMMAATDVLEKFEKFLFPSHWP